MFFLYSIRKLESRFQLLWNFSYRNYKFIGTCSSIFGAFKMDFIQPLTVSPICLNPFPRYEIVLSIPLWAASPSAGAFSITSFLIFWANSLAWDVPLEIVLPIFVPASWAASPSDFALFFKLSMTPAEAYDFIENTNRM